MATLADKTSLLVFRVGPVLCCAPSLSVDSIIVPPKLTHPPGSTRARPGIFKHGGHIVTGLDLRYKFGVDETDWVSPGRMIVTRFSKGHVGFWVDEILQVIEQPKSGWGPLPPLLPRGIFSRTLLLENEIYLYAEFDALYKIPDSGYLRKYIQHLLEQQQQQSTVQAVNATETTASASQPTKSATTSENVKPPASIPANPDLSRAGKSPSAKIPVKAPAKPAPRAVQRNTTAAAKPRQTALTPPAARPPSARPTVRAETAVQRPITSSVRQGTTKVNQQKPRRPDQTQGNNAGAWLLILLLLLLLGGSSWWLLKQPLPAPKQDVTEVSSAPAADAEPMAVMDPSPTSTPTTEETVTATNEAISATVTAPYSASIEKDQEGFTIVIDAPEDSDIFKSEDSKTDAVTATASDTPQANPQVEMEKDLQADSPPPQTVQPQHKPAPKTEVVHIVVKGDTLWHIAIRYLNNPYLYPELAKLSNIKNPDLIYPGNRVRITKRNKKSDS